jgi:hypothetical protein
VRLNIISENTKCVNECGKRKIEITQKSSKVTKRKKSMECKVIFGHSSGLLHVCIMCDNSIYG